ncbi:E3 ubiquitin-protein ligase RZFP34 isoform X2 [Brassica napus]|uniref:E3 ubiquitin-protein ligase RZFP34 isoform X2 n=1 Tax=Brassica napus TaxID=3708 RepID=UPI002078C88A|nr:E3 ubiquitin-protein ligase RZFP34 isoform X2 [Brassica napus]
MIFLGMMFQRLFARCVRQNKMFSRTAPVVAYVWGSTFAQNASSSMMIFPRSNTTAMNVGSAGPEEKKTSSIAKDVVRDNKNFMCYHLSLFPALILLPASGCCYSKVMEDKHRCVEGAMHHNCPVCFEYLFDSTRDITVLRCGHTMHLQCTKDMGLHNRYTCPVCSKSICDMSNMWKKLDEEVAAYPMPKVYEDKMVWILCNDCGSNTNVRFHLIAHKCTSCGSYNTRQTQRGPDTTHSCSSGVPQVVGSTG